MNDTTKSKTTKAPRRFAREPAAADETENANGPAVTTPVAKVSKQEAVIALLRRPDGATLVEMMEPTGWLPHTTRAVLTGLRKKGHAIEKAKRGDATCYRIVEVAA